MPSVLSRKSPGWANLRPTWAFAARFVTLAPNEEAYVGAVGRGELALEHLFPSAPQEAARLAQHPALLWKIANVREHLKPSV